MKTYKPVHDFAEGVRIAFSDVEDGDVTGGEGVTALPPDNPYPKRFLEKYGFNAEKSARVWITYKPEDTFTSIHRVTTEQAGKKVKADALYTTLVNQTITLTVADCVATVIYDPEVPMLGVLHLGRHSSVAGLIEEFAIEVADTVGSDPRDWHVWMSPSLRPDNDMMDYFDPPRVEQWQGFMRLRDDGKIHIDIAGHNRDRFERLGVRQANIYVSPINTYADERYYSHRAATELGRPERQGRMMVAATLTS